MYLIFLIKYIDGNCIDNNVDNNGVDGRYDSGIVKMEMMSSSKLEAKR